MAALRVFLPLAICLLLGHQTFATNYYPCQKSRWNNGFNTFVKRHIRADLPKTLNQNEWENYMWNNYDCYRPTQSFLRSEDLDKVKAVCTEAGGKTFNENLCISNQLFTFVTVRIHLYTCEIKSVIEEKKHLILACYTLGDDCLPVHFEGNPDKNMPNPKAGSCQAPQEKRPRTQR